MLRKLGFIGITCLYLLGCSMTATKPDFNQLPVVKFGDPIPKDQNYILYFPADTPIATHVSIEGNLLQQSVKDELSVKLNKDIYAYKQWVSYDKQHWSNSRDVMDVRAIVKIPGTHHPHPGIIQVIVSEKTPAAN